MSFILQPWHILLAAFCGLVQQRQQRIIEFQNAQIEALLKKLGRKRVLLTDNQRRLLAVTGPAEVLPSSGCVRLNGDQGILVSSDEGTL